MKTRQEAEAWVASLKPGDKVIQMDYRPRPVAVLTVKKVTATGIVRTEEDFSFRQSRYGSLADVRGCGASYGYIVPYNEDLAKRAEEYLQKIKAQNEERQILDRAKSLCWDLAYGKRELSLSLAKKIIELTADTGSEGGEHNDK